jgi:hypothetical protein
MVVCGLWQDIIAARNLVAFYTESLIHDLNTNFVESYNSVVTKFIGGKKVNYSLHSKLKLFKIIFC